MKVRTGSSIAQPADQAEVEILMVTTTATTKAEKKKTTSSMRRLIPMRRKRMRFKRMRKRAWYQPAAAGQRARRQRYADVSRLLPHREGVYHQYVAEIVEQHPSSLAVTSMVSALSTRALRSWPRIGGIGQPPAETQ